MRKRTKTVEDERKSQRFESSGMRLSPQAIGQVLRPSKKVGQAVSPLAWHRSSARYGRSCSSSRSSSSSRSGAQMRLDDKTGQLVIKTGELLPPRNATEDG